MKSEMEGQTDLLLFEAVKQGNESAFEILFKLHYQALCKTAFSIVKDRMVAEEIVSDFLLKIWTNRSTIQIQSTVEGYLHYAVRNASLNHLKSKGSPDKDIQTSEIAIPSEDQTPLEVMITSETVSEWEERIRQLPEQRQKVFRMNKLEGKSMKEIAKELSLSELTVRNHVQLAIRSLTEMVIVILAGIALLC